MTERRLHCRYLLSPRGWRENVIVTLDGVGRIVSIEPGGAAADQRLSGFVVPGMPNVHSHGFQVLLAGLTGPSGGGEDHFWSWRESMYRMANMLDPQAYEDCLSWVYLRMLQAGYTGCAEFHYLHHQAGGTPYSDPAEMSWRVLAAAECAGLPVTLLPVLYCRAGFSSTSVEPHQRRFHHELDDYLALIASCSAKTERNPLHGLGLAPHSLRAVPGSLLQEMLTGAPADLPLHIHVAEQPQEVTECLEQTGERPVQWLLEHLPVDQRWCLVHATHMTGSERVSAAASGAVAGLCPTTEADLGDGVFALDDWVHEGGAFGIGSDSNVRIDAAAELRWLEYEERLRLGRRNVLARAGGSAGESLYVRACTGGARAIGQKTGTLAPGFRADLVELDAGHPLLEGLPAGQVLDAWIFSGSEDMIRSVWIAGNRVIDQGRHPEQERVESAFRQVIKGIRA